MHGAAMNARLMEGFCGLNDKADKAGFIVVYVNGTGPGGVLLVWNSGGFRPDMSPTAVDDVGYISKVIDDLGTQVNVDPARVYATGMSNGGMMCYRLASELADRIAAIAPVAGTMAIDNYKPCRPVPVVHFHGTEDKLVPIGKTADGPTRYLGFKSVPETMRIVAQFNHCLPDPTVVALPDIAHDETSVTKKTYRPKEGDAEIVLYIIEGGGHTWPGRVPKVSVIGRSTKQIDANDIIWDFFEKHPMAKK
jgi:polyhydroxybutyrate depolymerase